MLLGVEFSAVCLPVSTRRQISNDPLCFFKHDAVKYCSIWVITHPEWLVISRKTVQIISPPFHPFIALQITLPLIVEEYILQLISRKQRGKI